MVRRSRLIEKFDLEDEIEHRLNIIIEGNKRALQQAARIATEASQSRFQRKLSGRPTVDPRPGRRTTQGTFGSYLVWQPEKIGKHHYARFQHEDLEAAAPYWLIQEIGTGNSARILDQGRTVSIKSQRGREISPTLSFADATGSYQRPSASRFREDQITTLKQAKNVPIEPRRRTIIQKEIEPKGFVRKGGHVGLSQYRKDLRQLMKQAFDR